LGTFDFSNPMKSDENEGRLKTVFLSNGQTVLLESKDPYGFWYIRWKEGKTPYELSEQTFTNFNSARQTLEIYLSKNKFNTEVVEEKVEPPVLEYKRKKLDK
jgi:hypothetical protein